MKQCKHTHKTIKWLTSLLVVVGGSVISAMPATAQLNVGLSVSFDDNETNFRTYTHNPDPDSLYEYGESAAVKALTDNDPSTNVELWYKSETPGITNKEIVDRNVGFTATNGKHQVRVSSVTASEWDVYGEEWVAGLLAKYTPLSEAMDQLSEPAQEVFEASFKNAGLGDPNVSEFSLDTQGNIRLQTAGFYDLRDVIEQRALESKQQAEMLAQLATEPQQVKDVAAAKAGLTAEELDEKIGESVAVVEGLSALISAVKQLNQELQASEVAKVEIYEDGVLKATEYAYTFEMLESGIEALDDGESYSGLAEWTYAGEGSAGVPEPSFLLGAAIAGGLFRSAKRRSQRKA